MFIIFIQHIMNLCVLQTQEFEIQLQNSKEMMISWNIRIAFAMSNLLIGRCLAVILYSTLWQWLIHLDVRDDFELLSKLLITQEWKVNHSNSQFSKCFLSVTTIKFSFKFLFCLFLNFKEYISFEEHN